MTRMTRWVVRSRSARSVMTMHRDGSLWRPILRNFISTEQTVLAFMFPARADKHFHNQERQSLAKELPIE